MKIIITTDKSGNIRKIRTNGDLDISRSAVKTAADKPRRYKMKRTRRSRAAKCLKKHLSRIGYILAQTASAFKLACNSAFSREDIQRHQS